MTPQEHITLCKNLKFHEEYQIAEEQSEIMFMQNGIEWRKDMIRKYEAKIKELENQ